MKQHYLLQDSEDMTLLADCHQYNDDLGTMWALRTLANLKKRKPNLKRAILWRLQNGRLELVQTLRKRGL